MSAIVALCHFCEVHGPSVVMVTQSIQDTIGDIPNSNSFYEQIKNSSLQRNSGKITGCERCWSLKNNQNLILSKDEEGKHSFVSSQTVLKNDIEILLKNAVNRAISCEVSVKREGPLIFSNPSVSTVFANNFFLKDSRARGFQRYYSVLLLTKEREHLISNLKLIESSTSQLIDHIKSMSKTTFESEATEVKDKVGNHDVFQRRRGSTIALRNLRDIVGDQNIFKIIHQQFVAMLQSMEKVLKEKVLSGQVMKSSVTFHKPSLNTILDMKQQLGSVGFKILLHHILSGKTLQIKSRERNISRQIGDSLCLFLPNNLSRNQIYFANLILTSNDLVDDLPTTAQLEISSNITEVEGAADENLTYSISSPNCACFDGLEAIFSSCKYCRNLNESTIVARFCKILKSCEIPKTVQEMSIRTFGEMILLQSRVYSKLAQHQRKDFLFKNKYTAIDAEIFVFFKYFS